MNVKDIIKKQTTIIAIAVILVTIAAISVSYAIFFDIKAGQTQTITAGTLKMEITIPENSKPSLDTAISTEEGLKSNPINYTVSNTDSNLPAKYNLYICTSSISDDGTENETDVKLLPSIYYTIVSGTENTNSEAKQLNTISETYNRNDNDSEETQKGKCYKIDADTVAANSTNQTKSLRVWLDDSQIVDDIEGAKINLELLLVGEVDEQNAKLNPTG